MSGHSFRRDPQLGAKIDARIRLLIENRAYERGVRCGMRIAREAPRLYGGTDWDAAEAQMEREIGGEAMTNEDRLKAYGWTYSPSTCLWTKDHQAMPFMTALSLVLLDEIERLTKEPECVTGARNLWRSECLRDVLAERDALRAEVAALKASGKATP